MKLLLLLLTAASAFAGDTYDCINAKGDYINYGPPVPREINTLSIIAHDSTQYEPRWRLMLDPNDLRHLIFEQARHQPREIRITP